MKKYNRKLLICLFTFILCYIARIIEYFFIRTDETILAENFLHKVFGIIILVLIVIFTNLTWNSIGFTKKAVLKNIFKGLILGTICFSIAYFIECIVLYCMNGNVQISIHTSSFSLNGAAIKQTGIEFVFLCIIFNLINVCMEEGIFRGLFTRLLIDKFDFRNIVLFNALLFGIWHWVMPMRDFIERESNLTNLLVMGVGYIILSGIMSIKWSILYRITGSLWMGLGDHLFNNVIVTNLLHVISNNEADNMQIVRILLGQVISFVLVIIYYKNTFTHKQYDKKEI